MHYRLRLALLIVVPCTGIGCSTPGVLKPRATAETASQPKRSDADPAYRVAAGDALEIHRRGARKETAEVRVDGNLQLAGETIRVDDLTPQEIACRVRERLGDEYRDCQVVVAKFNSQYIYVFGDGREESPRAVPYQGRETLRDFVARVGCRECLRGYRARIVRPNKDMGAKPEVLAVKLDADFQNRERGAEPVYLQPNDYVYLERDGAGPGGVLPRGNRFWPMTKFTFWKWRKDNKAETARRAADADPFERDG
jgi:protein involved in polysaccharide export with SLBB domain